MCDMLTFSVTGPTLVLVDADLCFVLLCPSLCKIAHAQATHLKTHISTLNPSSSSFHLDNAQASLQTECIEPTAVPLHEVCAQWNSLFVDCICYVSEQHKGNCGENSKKKKKRYT